MSISNVTIHIYLLVLIISFQQALGIECYRCLPKTGAPGSNQSCALFDRSYEYRIDCPLSTFCMKRNYTLVFPDGRNAMVTERGCAPQSLSYRIHKKGQWETVHNVEEDVYQDGCVFENIEAGSPTQYCYCSSRLCNNFPKLVGIPQYLMSFILVLWLLN